MHLFEGMRCLGVELFPGEVYIPEVYNKNDCKLFVKTESHKYIRLIKKIYLLFSLTYEIGFIFYYKKNLSYGSEYLRLVVDFSLRKNLFINHQYQNHY